MSYKVGDEFVIRIGEKYNTTGIVNVGSETTNKPNCLYRVEGFNALTFDENGLDKLDRLNDDYINENYGMFQDAAYQKGLEDAWKIATKMISKWEGSRTGCNTDDFDEIFEFKSLYQRFTNYTASEALEKIREYEEKQDEIKVGDEVKDGQGFVFTVLHIDERNNISGMTQDGIYRTWVGREVKRTGRHFPQIAEVLEQMREETE